MGELRLTLGSPDLRIGTLESAWMRPEEIWIEASSVKIKQGNMVLAVIVFLFKVGTGIFFITSGSISQQLLNFVVHR